MRLPETFIQTIKNTYKEDGEKFLTVLPLLLEEAARRWGLTEITPVPDLSYNFVAFAKRQGADVVLKMGVPNRELTGEMNALKLFNGQGACQLLDCDEERGFLLLERVKPGMTLAELEDDDERTRIAAGLMQSIWRPADRDPQTGQARKFIQLSDWFAGLGKIRPHFNGGLGPFPKALLETVEAFLPELFAGQAATLLHGDFHHFNILLSAERGWLVIDPKGVIGPAGYEAGPLLLNPWHSLGQRAGFKRRSARRLDILAEHLGWERGILLKWAAAHAVLSAWWCIEDRMDIKYSLQCAEIFLEMGGWS